MRFDLFLFIKNFFIFAGNFVSLPFIFTPNTFQMLAFCWKNYLRAGKRESTIVFKTIGYCFYCSFLENFRGKRLLGEAKVVLSERPPCSSFLALSPVFVEQLSNVTSIRNNMVACVICICV